MTMELNIFNITKQPHDEEDRVIDLDVVEKSVDHTLPYNLSDDPLQEWLTHFRLVFDDNNAFLDSWNSKKEQLTPSGENPIPSSESPTKIELKPSPGFVTYTFLGEENTLSKIISSSLDVKQKNADVIYFICSLKKRLQLGEPKEIRNDENAKDYKKRMKVFHDK